jgi:inorganic triphosphatase YgiF
MKIEKEVKFVIGDLVTFNNLRLLTTLSQFQLKPMGSKKNSDRYLDTSDRRIFRAGYACRIRSVQQKKILTLKSLDPPQGEIHRRREIELEITTDQPEAWVGSEARDLVLSAIGDEPLQTLFTIYQTRHKYQAHLHDEPVIELSLDEVSMGEPGTVSYFELEAELIEAGSETDLALFVDALRTHWDLRLETRSKFERALQNQADKWPAK